jgi:hypothetical protein
MMDKLCVSVNCIHLAQNEIPKVGCCKFVSGHLIKVNGKEFIEFVTGR